VQDADIGNAIVIPVNLATPTHPPRLDSNSSLMSGTSVDHLPSVALIPSHTATTNPVTMTVMTALCIAMCLLDASAAAPEVLKIRAKLVS
jgi:hypothetical protein